MTGHTMNVKLDRDTVVLTPVCHEPEGAFCRLSCDSGCEYWSEGHGTEDEEGSDSLSHQLIDFGYCNAIECLTNDDADMAELCADENEISLFDGMPITMKWNGHGYEWRKASDDSHHTTT